MVWGSMFCCIQLVVKVSGMMLCVTSLMDVGCTVINVNGESFHLYANFWQDNIIGAGIYDCTQQVHW